MPNLETQIEELKTAGYPVKKGIRQFLSSDKSDIATDIWLHRWSKHAAQNYPIISRSHGIRILDQCAINVPAFVIGIGPSLDKNIDCLKHLKGSALLLSTDAAYRVLLAKGIKPDLVMTLDCKKEQNTIWDGAFNDNPHVPTLVCNACSHPLTIKSWEGPILFYNEWNTKSEFIEKLLPNLYPHLGQIPSSGTVGNMLVDLANMMGCNPILTVGMDLCYKKEGDGWRYRCQDYMFYDGQEGSPNPYQPGWRKTENKLLYDNDDRVRSSFDEEINGERFRVDRELKMYRESFVELAGLIGHKVIDCSIDGILKMFIRNISIEQTVREFNLRPLSAGRTVIPYLEKIIPNGKELWAAHAASDVTY